MSKYKIIVFDLDGTLVNSLQDLANAANEGLKKAGLPTHDAESYRKFVGNGREVLFEKAMGDCRDPEKFRIVSETFADHYSVHCNDNTESYPGCKEMLAGLKALGIRTAVLSNKPDEFVEMILNKVYPGVRFAAAWGKRREYPRKPNGAALKAMLAELGFGLSDCLYIGDSDVDAFTAANAGVDMIGVEWGFRGRKELLDTGAPFVAKTADEILEYINEQ